MKKTVLPFILLMAGCFLVFATFHNASAQEHQVAGKVTGSDGMALPGITIQVKGTTNGTTTNANGLYQLQVSADATLIFRGIGYTEQSIEVNGRSTVNVTMSTSTQLLNELVVTALGRTENKAKIGYSATTFNSSEINENAPLNMLDNLAGKVAGAQISTLGGPGSSTKVVLRGFGVIAGGSNQPLYVIDGVPLSDHTPGSTDPLTNTGNLDFGNGMSAVNPADIKSITILKGTAATALYGSSARNGAVMITTKRGKEGAIRIDYTGSVVLSSVGKLPKMQEKFGNGWGFRYIPSENGSWGPRLDGKMRPWGSIVDNSQLVKPFSFIEDNIRDFYDIGVGVHNSLGVSGGSAHNRFYFSYSNVSSNGVVPTRADYLQRNTFSLRTNSHYGNFSVNTSFNYINRKMNTPLTGQNPPSGGGVFQSLLQIPVDIPISDFQLYKNKFFNIDNYFTPFAENPYFGLNENGNQQNSDRFFGNLDLKYQFTPEFSAELRLGGDFRNARTFRWMEYAAARPGSWNGPNPANPEGATKTPDIGSVEKISQHYGTINGDFILEYDKQFNSDFGLDVIAGANFYQSTFNGTDAAITNLVIPGFFNLSNSLQPPTATDSRSRRRRMGLYGQAVFNFKDQLYVTGNVRNDWSSTLPINNNSIFYPGANISWIASNTFDIVSGAVSFLKLRAAYGMTGADPSPYQTYSVLNAANISLGFGFLNSPFNGVPAFGVSNTINNANLQPIITREFETGFDARFLQNRIGLNFSFYNKITDGQIFPVLIDPSTGYSSLVQNLGKVRNRGVEITLHVTPIQTGSFEWNFSYTFAKNNNEVLNLNGGLPNPLLNALYDAELRAVVGKTVAEIYAPTPQLSPKGKIVVSPSSGFPLVNTTPDSTNFGTTLKDYGSALYDYTMGFSSTFTYKNISLGFSLDFRHGGVMYSQTLDLLNFVGNAYNTTYNDRKPFIIPNSVIEVTNSGKTSYIENTIPIPAEDVYDYFYPRKNPAMAYDVRIFDRSFLKLRSVNLSYQLPDRWTGSLHLRNISVGIFAKNILVWTPAENFTIDPEATNMGNDLEGELGEFSTAPLSKQFGFTLKASF